MFLHAKDAKLVDKIPMEFINAYKTDKVLPVKRTIKDDYKLCQGKLKDAFVKVNGVSAVAINENYALSLTKPKSYQVYNPFYKLYIIQKKDEFKSFKKAEDCNKTYLASIGKYEINYGKLIDLNSEFGVVDFDAKKNSLIVTPCCQVLGVGVGKNKFLTNLELQKLTYRKSPYDGYIGANFYQRGKKVFVRDVDFNLKNILFCPNDEIVSIDTKKISSIEALRRIVLPAKKGDTVEVVVKRGGKKKKLNIKVISKPRYNIDSSSYIEKLGARFDRNLVVKKVFKNSLLDKKGIYVGDRLMELNFKKVVGRNGAKRRFMYDKRDDFQLLFTRKDFQFFINFNRKDIKGGLFALKYCPAI